MRTLEINNKIKISVKHQNSMIIIMTSKETSNDNKTLLQTTVMLIFNLIQTKSQKTNLKIQMFNIKILVTNFTMKIFQKNKLKKMTFQCKLIMIRLAIYSIRYLMKSYNKNKKYQKLTISRKEFKKLIKNLRKHLNTKYHKMNRNNIQKKKCHKIKKILWTIKYKKKIKNKRKDLIKGIKYKINKITMKKQNHRVIVNKNNKIKNLNRAIRKQSKMAMKKQNKLIMSKKTFKN